LTDAPPKPVNPKPRRRWFRFSLRTLLILTVVLSVAFGWLGSILVRVRHQRRIIADVQMYGGSIIYEHQLINHNLVDHHAPLPGPTILRVLLGDDAFAHVEVVSLLWGKPVDDVMVERLSELPQLKHIVIFDGSNITDQGMQHFEPMSNLQHLHVEGLSVSDLAIRRLAGLGNLRRLALGPNVSAKAAMALKGDLPNCEIRLIDSQGTSQIIKAN